MDMLDSKFLVDHLWATGCVNDWQKKSMAAKKIDHERNKLLLDIFLRRSRADLDRLVYCIIASGQPHVAKILSEDGGEF